MNIEELPTEKDWVGQCVRYWRLHYGLQQADVAAVMTEHLGVKWTQGVVANIEGGRRSVSLYELLALCMVFEKPLHALLYPRMYDNTPNMPHPVPEPIQTPDGERSVRPSALHEAFGLDVSSEYAELVADVTPGSIRPSAVREARAQYLPDPEFQAMQTATHVNNGDKLRAYVDSTYRDAFGGRRKKFYTATDLVNAVEQQMREEQPNKEYQTEHAQRTLRYHARRRATDLVVRKVISEL